MIRPFAILLTLAGIFNASQADAQYVVHSGYASSAPSYRSTTYSSYYSVPAAPTRMYSYSYYTRPPLPARTYVGYGRDEFAFHGQPYGHPYDPWTWPMMTDSYANGLARYYDPPVK
jgi:hypothetical protein